MGNRTVFWLMVGLLAIAAMVGVGCYAYSAGVAHGIAESAHAAGGAPPVVTWPWWGFGFGFFPVFFFILLWVVVLRGLNLLHVTPSMADNARLPQFADPATVINAIDISADRYSLWSDLRDR